MRFVFNSEKAAQAAAVLLQAAGGEMYHIHLLKLLYLADRQSLLETGYPITGARMVSMDKGPVLSEVYELISWGEAAESPWSRIISDQADYRIRLRAPSDAKKLSAYEVELLERVFEKWGRWNRWDLVKFTHSLSEWHDPDGSSVPIDIREIFESAGRTPQEIEDIAAQIESVRTLHRMTDARA